MIVLKILLIILLVILGLILTVLILPVGADLSFIDGKLRFKVKLWILNVMDSEGGGLLGWLKKRKKKKKRKEKKKKSDPESDEYSDISFDDLEFDDADVSEAYETTDSAEDEPVPEAAVDAAANENTAAASSEAATKETAAEKAAEEDISADVTDDTDDSSDKKKKEKSDDSDITDKIDFILSTVDVAWAPLKRIFKGFRFSNLYVDFIIANEDAYKCAISYGRFCGIFYNGLAALSRIFTVRLKTVDVQPGFGLKKGRYDASFSLDFRAGTVVIAGFAFLITFIFKVFIPSKLKKRKRKKSAAVQK